MPNNPLLNIYSSGSYNTGGQTTPAVIGGRTLDTETLPYGGGIFNPAGDSAITPEPIFQGGAPSAPAAPVAPPTPPAKPVRGKYINPKTGEKMTPQEYALYLSDKIPKGTGQIPSYAGDALAKPDQSANELIKIATNLNNARNDLATGAKDPYGVGKSSGVAYSPEELKAIEKAYAGIYDPALNDAFSRLRDKQTSDAKIVAREDLVFRTNEAIRQWRATTGTKKTGDGTGGYDFTKTQIANGASAAGMSLIDFKALESDDVRNLYINPPKAKGSEGTQVPIYQNFEEDMIAITEGSLDRQILVDEILASKKISPDVKTYFIAKIPAAPEERETWYEKIWSRLPFVD